MTQEKAAFNFLDATDETGVLINEKANELFATLKSLDASKLNIEATFKEYFIKHHLGATLSVKWFHLLFCKETVL